MEFSSSETCTYSPIDTALVHLYQRDYQSMSLTGTSLKSTPAESICETMLPIGAVETETTAKPTSSRSKRSTLLAVMVGFGLLFLVGFGLAAYHYSQPESVTGLTEFLSATSVQKPPAYSFNTGGPCAKRVSKMMSKHSGPPVETVIISITQSRAGVVALSVAILIVLGAAIIAAIFLLNRQSAVNADEEEPKGDVVVVEPSGSTQDSDGVVEGSSIVSILKWVFGCLAVFVVIGVARRCHKDGKKGGPQMYHHVLPISRSCDQVYALLAFLFGSDTLTHSFISYKASEDGETHFFQYTVPIAMSSSLTHLDVIIYALHSHKTGGHFEIPTKVTVTKSDHPHFDLLSADLSAIVNPDQLTVTIDCTEISYGLESPILAMDDSVAFWEKIDTALNAMSAEQVTKLTGTFLPRVAV